MTSPTSFERLFRLDGHVAVVTGGAGRLGSQYVNVLASAGASVAALDVTDGPGPAVQRLIAENPSTVSFHHVDATQRGPVDAVVEAILGRFGAPTILVNNAGLGSSPADAALETGPFEHYPEGAWTAMIDSHLKSTLVASQAFIAAFRRARATNPSLTGSIINVSSTYGLVTPDQSLYDFRRKDGQEYYKPV